MILAFGLRIFYYSEPEQSFCKLNTKGAIGFDREVRIIEACRATAYPKNKRKLNTTADSFEYALAA
jgi:hypothetical protein